MNIIQGTPQDLLEANGPREQDKGPVTCLGRTFDNDYASRAHFAEELRKKLQDPEFRKIEGLPIGSDEDILNLSDSPYYTACPNPWIADFIAEWEAQKPEQPDGYQYHREAFAADVSEGKNDPIYNAHSYHTKVPHKAIMRYTPVGHLVRGVPGRSIVTERIKSCQIDLNSRKSSHVHLLAGNCQNTRPQHGIRPDPGQSGAARLRNGAGPAQHRDYISALAACGLEVLVLDGGLTCLSLRF